MFRKSHYLAFSLVLLMVVVFLNLPSQATAQLKLALSSLFLPLFGLVNASQHVAQRTGDAIVPKSTLIEEVNRLRKENSELRLQLQQTEDAMKENDRLHQQVNWLRRTKLKARLARVVGRDPSNWWRTIQVDLGSRDEPGLSSNMAVVTSDGLVGRISSVGYLRSQVVLLGDPNCRVAALVEKTRENGVITSSSATVLEPNMVELTYLTRNSKLEPEQTVVTSGLGGVIFPAGIPIGTIVDSRAEGYGLYTEARVKLAVNLNQLEEVWVLFK